MPTKDPNKKSLSELTITEIKNILKPNGTVLAVGKYQAISKTFNSWVSEESIKTDSIFNSQLQERLGNWLMTKKRPDVANYVNGGTVTLEKAQLALAQEFASIPIPGPPDSNKGYYDGTAGNSARTTSGYVQQALTMARSSNNLQIIKDFVGQYEGVYDSINRGTAGDTQLYSPNYYSALLEQSTTTATVTQDNESYITQTYVEPYKDNTTDRSLANDILRRGLKTSDIITQNELQGELTLIRLLENIQSGQQAQVNAVENRLKNFTPLAQQELVVQRLFAIDADEMRNQLASNMYADKNFSTTHAWRAPGKLAVTANLTIPGMSGFRIAQIFWIDRILENYKATGAFQLFGLTEHIDINRGWTTELYARYNVIPRKAMSNIKDSVEYLNLKNLTNKMKNANPSANIKDTSFNPANAPSVTSLGTPIVKNPLTGR